MSDTKKNKRLPNSNSSFLGNTPRKRVPDDEAMANLVNFVELLIQMDVQQKELKKRDEKT